MSVRVVARIRPLLKAEIERDVIVQAATTDENSPTQSLNLVRIPNPRCHGEDFSFQFNSVYDAQATQEELFKKEVEPTVKSLFQGLDVTLFAYGVTGTGKTHTMRGGKSMADRGLIPRFLSGVYRKGRKLVKDSKGETTVQVAMSYYEIYNDRVFDLFEALEKRTATGLPLREANGKTVVVGLTERPCESLKEFEQLYDQANINRSTSATKLNAVSSRSHAILRVKLSVTTGEKTTISTASAIDLAGSEDNRRTENGKERMVESASINKSLFVLAQCVEAISKNHSRIPYRESKMTRILSLGQNNGVTVMILNLAPVKSYHLDTLSSLNFANRTKKIEVKEIENEPIFKGPPARAPASCTGATIQRQPLRALNHIPNALPATAPEQKNGKPLKQFAVYSDKSKPGMVKGLGTAAKRDSGRIGTDRSSQGRVGGTSAVTKASIEQLVERKVEEILAARALNENHHAPVADISEQVQKRLDMLEQKVEQKQDARSEGLNYLLMAKQHYVRGEDVSALKMYELATPFFPNNEKLASKKSALEEKLRQKKNVEAAIPAQAQTNPSRPIQPVSHVLKPLASKAGSISQSQIRGHKRKSSTHFSADDDSSFVSTGHYSASPSICSYHSDYDNDDSFRHHARRAPKSKKRAKVQIYRDESDFAATHEQEERLLGIINSHSIGQIKNLKGVGAKKAEAIVASLSQVGGLNENVRSIDQLRGLKGVGEKTVQSMLAGLL